MKTVRDDGVIALVPAAPLFGYKRCANAIATMHSAVGQPVGNANGIASSVGDVEEIQINEKVWVNPLGDGEIKQRDPWFIRVDCTWAIPSVEVLLRESNGLDNRTTTATSPAFDANMLVRLIFPDNQALFCIPMSWAMR
jgi:hypothetical protein